MMKRVFDIVVASIALFVLSIPMLVVAAVVRVSLGSPVLFRQVRPGRHGRPFTILKFRTMRSAASEAEASSPDEVRLTPVGRLLRRWSLDELPQLFNVLGGDLSLVGPRPLLMEYLGRYTAEQARRHEVRPGITGWAQVNGRNTLSWEESLRLDVWYVDHQSFWLDLRILWLTAVKVVSGEGVSTSGYSSREKFGG